MLLLHHNICKQLKRSDRQRQALLNLLELPHAIFTRLIYSYRGAAMSLEQTRLCLFDRVEVSQPFQRTPRKLEAFRCQTVVALGTVGPPRSPLELAFEPALVLEPEQQPHHGRRGNVGAPGELPSVKRTRW